MNTAQPTNEPTKQPLTVDEDPVNGKHYMAIMGREGDTKHMWSKDNPEEVEVARNMFNDFKKKGYAAFRVKKNGEPADQMHTFDPEAERIIFVKQMAGG